MSRKSYQWLVDRKKTNEAKGETHVNIDQDGITLRLDRIAFGQYAAVDMAYVEAADPFKLVPTDSSHGDSGHAISFQIALSGKANGTLPGLGTCVIDSQWGLLTDFSEGNAEFIIDPAEPLRTLGGTLSVEQIQTLFSSNGFDAEIDPAICRHGIIKSFPVTSTMRNIVSTALATPLIGPLRRLYLEGTVLQLFALILQKELSEPVNGEPILTQQQAERESAILAEELLTRDIANPPTLLELSRATGLSMRKLSNAFRETYSMNIVEYLTDQRLQAARDLMHDQPDYPLKALAGDVGYNHLSNFTTAFKRKFGLPPAAYIKTIR